LKKENFKKGDVLVDVGGRMNKIIIIQQGYIDLKIKTSIIETFCF